MVICAVDLPGGIPERVKLNRFLVVIMAVAAGMAVANLYYIQPLLGEIARSFHATQVSVGFTSMLTQVGYAFGMLIIRPLADIREKRSLIVLMHVSFFLGFNYGA